jgi:hypothetical protein
MAKVVRAILVCRKWNQQTRQHEEHSRREVDATKVGRYWRAGLKTFNADGTETRASRSGASGFCRYHLEFTTAAATEEVKESKPAEVAQKYKTYRVWYWNDSARLVSQTSHIDAAIEAIELATVAQAPAPDHGGPEWEQYRRAVCVKRVECLEDGSKVSYKL